MKFFFLTMTDTVTSQNIDLSSKSPCIKFQFQPHREHRLSLSQKETNR